MEEQNNLISHDVQNGEIQARLIPCAHCEGKGSCRSGKDGSSCDVCVKEHFGCLPLLFSSKVRHGLVCNVCEGSGHVEPKTERMHKRLEPLLSTMLAYVALFMVWVMAALDNKPFFRNTGILFNNYWQYYRLLFWR